MNKVSRHFARAEFACSDNCGFDTIDVVTLQVLEHVRLHFGKPVIISSGCRCEAVNKAVGGSKHSFHMQGRAVDFYVKDVDSGRVADWLDETYPHRFGIGKYNSWVHFDSRTNGPARWEG